MALELTEDQKATLQALRDWKGRKSAASPSAAQLNVPVALYDPRAGRVPGKTLPSWWDERHQPGPGDVCCICGGSRFSPSAAGGMVCDQCHPPTR